MFIDLDPDRSVPTSSSTTCAYHKANPGVVFAGCSCSASWGVREATPEEYLERRKRRLKVKKLELEKELHLINLELEIDKISVEDL